MAAVPDTVHVIGLVAGCLLETLELRPWNGSGGCDVELMEGR